MDYPKVKKVLIITLILNWIVASAKIFAGFMTGAISVLADGFHSLFDGASNVLGLIGVKIAERPRDESHPYGHGKFESVAALGIAFMVIIAGYEFSKSTIQRFLAPALPEITVISFLVVTFALAADLFTYRYELSRGKKLGSQILVADATHTKSHLLTTPAVLLGMAVIKLGFPILDPIIALFVVVMLGKLAWDIIGHTTTVLCDRAFVDEAKIRDIVRSVEGIASSHQIRTRGDEHHVFLDMHITMDSELPLLEAHNISHVLKNKIIQELPQIKDVVIHIEPRI
jgi:cation diffusion facilitator family transporter